MAAPRRVLLVAEQLRRTVPGGIGTYVRGLVQGLQAMDDDGPEVVAWASRHPGREQPDRVAQLGLSTVTSRLPGPLLTRAWDHGISGRRGAADVLHATSLAVPPPGGLPTTAFVHDLAWRSFPETFPRRGRRWHEAALGRAIERAAILLVPSRLTADALVAAGAPAAGVEVVPHGSDHLPPADHPAAASLLARLGVRSEYLLTVSTLEPRKNLPRLLAAYRAARPLLPEPWPLVVVGPVGWGPALPSEPGVVLTGPQEGAVLAALYARARVVAYVPLLEGFGLPVLEAMVACAPVVASPVPSAGGAALEVAPDDVGGIAEALVAAASDEPTRAQLVTAGLLRAGELSWEACARAHVSVWETLVR